MEDFGNKISTGKISTEKKKIELSSIILVTYKLF